MFFRKKPRGLYYMLPGMNRSNRIRNRKVFRWSLAFAIFISAAIGFLIYWIGTSHRRY